MEGEEILNVVQYHKKEISDFIYSQLLEHYYCEPAEYKEPIIYPFAEIKEHKYSNYLHDKLYYYTETITPTNAISSMVSFGAIKR
ncbi:MAG TPA: hypothetical protein DEB05_11710 [Firmicutes bacterium]|nr:hypothetical protein [Bacillota bacterium]